MEPLQSTLHTTEDTVSMKLSLLCQYQEYCGSEELMLGQIFNKMQDSTARETQIFRPRQKTKTQFPRILCYCSQSIKQNGDRA